MTEIGEVSANKELYRKLRKDPNWLSHYLGKWIVIDDGAIVADFTDREIMKVSNIQAQVRENALTIKVEKEDPEYD